MQAPSGDEGTSSQLDDAVIGLPIARVLATGVSFPQPNKETKKKEAV